MGIETSCDETAAAVVVSDPARPGRPRLVSSIVASQMAMHRPFGGIVPEIASRAHIRFVTDVMGRALEAARLAAADLDVVAATAGPGLPGSLLVGLSAGKALAYLFRRPFVAVNHIEAHIYSAFLAEPDLEPPLLALVVSGGHTDLISMPRHGTFKIHGRTRDDAAGEAFDKVAKMMSLGYPGGPALERIAGKAKRAVKLPVARMKDGSLDFSFSGLKTAVANALPRARSRGEVARGFQQAVLAALSARTVELLGRERLPVLVLAGGVAANRALRRHFALLTGKLRVRLVVPEFSLCTDNAAMVACAGWFLARSGARSRLSAPAVSSWGAGSKLESAVAGAA